MAGVQRTRFQLLTSLECWSVCKGFGRLLYLSDAGSSPLEQQCSTGAAPGCRSGEGSGTKAWMRKNRLWIAEHLRGDTFQARANISLAKFPPRRTHFAGIVCDGSSGAASVRSQLHGLCRAR